jgi:hypothetical protein
VSATTSTGALDGNKAKLLQFVTGTAGVPVQGFQALQGNDGNLRKFTLHGDKNAKVFPRAHTCFNRIDIPMYKTKADMQKYLAMAISFESSGFGIGALSVASPCPPSLSLALSLSLSFLTPSFSSPISPTRPHRVRQLTMFLA